MYMYMCTFKIHVELLFLVFFCSLADFLILDFTKLLHSLGTLTRYNHLICMTQLKQSMLFSEYSVFSYSRFQQKMC